MTWLEVKARVIEGHQVASGKGEDPRFPGGTLAMQLPYFAELGLDLTPFHLATMNLSIAPLRYQVLASTHTFRDVKWSSSEPAEDFSFFDCEIRPADSEEFAKGMVYYPHPETKPEHFQPPDVLEVLAPALQGITYGITVDLRLRDDQWSLSSES